MGLLAAGLTAIALFAAQGCSSSDDSGQATPTGGKPNAGGTSSTAGSGGKAGSSSTAGSAGKTSGNGGSGGSGGTGAGGTDATPEGGAPDTGEAGAGTCDGPDGCYSCKPTTTPQFANHCVTGGCPATFDNTTITTLDKLGTL